MIATQNRAFLSNEELGIFKVQAATSVTRLEVSNAELESAYARAPASPLGTVTMQPIDATGPDGRSVQAWVGAIDPKLLQGRDGTVRARLKVDVDGEQIEQVFQFIFTGSTPATIEGFLGHLQTPSQVLLRLGIAVTVSGSYAFEVRLWNERGEAVALLKTTALLGRGRQEVTLPIGSAFQRDWLLPGTYEATDAEAFRDSGSGGRQAVVPWRGSYAFPITDSIDSGAAPPKPDLHKPRPVRQEPLVR